MNHQPPLQAFIALFGRRVGRGCATGGGEDPHRWAAGVSLDVGSIPDAFATQCGSGTTPAYGGGLSVLVRPRRWLIVAADTRVSTFPDVGFGCSLNLPAPVQVGPNEYENWADKEYPKGVPRTPLYQSVLHVGVETPPGSPLFRATVGGGVIWTGRRTPMGTMAIGGGSRGGGARFYWELETSVCRVDVREEHTRFRFDSNTTTPLPSRIVSYVEHPRWTLLHLGLERPPWPGRSHGRSRAPAPRGRSAISTTVSAAGVVARSRSAYERQYTITRPPSSLCNMRVCRSPSSALVESASTSCSWMPDSSYSRPPSRSALGGQTGRRTGRDAPQRGCKRALCGHLGHGGILRRPRPGINLVCEDS